MCERDIVREKMERVGADVNRWIEERGKACYLSCLVWISAAILQNNQ